MKTYTTTETARMIGIHPNTVRMYEELGLISQTKRKDNGYRIFTDLHIDQFRLARAAFKVEILQNGLRKKAIRIIKTSAKKDFDKAILLAKDYLLQIQQEKAHAEETIEIVKDLLSNTENVMQQSMKRKEVSDYLGISMDTLRNWELNGLLEVKRKKNGYRVYTGEDILRLKIIRSLRCANYSLSAILRMLNALSTNPDIDIKNVIDTPKPDDDIITACDKLITSLELSHENALYMLSLLERMKINTK